MQNVPGLYYHCYCLTSLVAQSCPVLRDPMDCSTPGSPSPWDFPGRNTGLGCHFLLQGTCMTQGLNSWLLCLLYCRWILYLLGHWWRPLILHIYKPIHSAPSMYTELYQALRVWGVSLLAYNLAKEMEQWGKVLSNNWWRHVLSFSIS